MHWEPPAQTVTYARILGSIVIWQATRFILPPSIAFGLIWLARGADATVFASKEMQLLVLATVPVAVYAVALVATWKLFESANLRACTCRYYHQPVRAIDVCVGATVGVLLAVTWLYLSGHTGRHITAMPIDSHAGLGGSALLAFISLTIFCVVVAAPIAEEVFYRGVLLEAFSRRAHVALSVGAVALIFTVSHVGSVPNRWEAFAIMAVLAVAASVLTLRAESVGGAIAMHFSFNLFPVVHGAFY